MNAKSETPPTEKTSKRCGRHRHAIFTSHARPRLASGYPLPGCRPAELDMGVGMAGDLYREYIHQQHILDPHQSRDHRGARPAWEMKDWDKIVGGLWGLAQLVLSLVAGMDVRFGWTGELSDKGTYSRCCGVCSGTWALRMGDD